MTATNGLGVMSPQRWPLEPLLCFTRSTQAALARRIGVSPSTVGKARRRGLNDRQADHWATAVGLHPALIWGPAWFDAAPREEPAEVAS